jgi:hypothetical protein
MRFLLMDCLPPPHSFWPGRLSVGIRSTVTSFDLSWFDTLMFAIDISGRRHGWFILEARGPPLAAFYRTKGQLLPQYLPVWQNLTPVFARSYDQRVLL